MIDREQLHRDGYALLRGAIPAEGPMGFATPSKQA
jgi:hypothetical protein